MDAQDLMLCEGSAARFTAQMQDGLRKQVVRVSRLGDYISRRANVKIDGHENRKDFAQMVYLEVDLSLIFNLMLKNYKQ